MTKFARFILVGFMAFSLSACGGDDGNGGNGGATEVDPDQAAAAIQALTSFAFFFGPAPAGLVLDELKAQTSFDCPEGGTIEVTETTITYNNCNMGNGIIMSGSISFSESGSSFTMTLNNFSIDDGVDNITMNGSMTFNETTSTITYNNLTYSVGGDTFGIDGELTMNEDLTLDGDLDFFINGDLVASCTFTSFSGTEEEILESCDF